MLTQSCPSLYGIATVGELNAVALEAQLRSIAGNVGRFEAIDRICNGDKYLGGLWVERIMDF